MLTRILAYTLLAALLCLGIGMYFQSAKRDYAIAAAEMWQKDPVIQRTAAVHYMEGQADALTGIRGGEELIEKVKEARNAYIVACVASKANDELGCREEFVREQPNLVTRYMAEKEKVEQRLISS
jgi:hypothetical protein